MATSTRNDLGRRGVWERLRDKIYARRYRRAMEWKPEDVERHRIALARILAGAGYPPVPTVAYRKNEEGRWVRADR